MPVVANNRVAFFLMIEQYSIGYIYIFIHSSFDGHKLFPYFGYCEQCCYEHESVDIFSTSCVHFLWMYTQKWDFWVIQNFHF